MSPANHPGCPLRSTYVKMISSAECEDCEGFEESSLGNSAEHLRMLRQKASEHAGVAHHRVTMHLAQDVIIEPMHPQTREKALRGLPDVGAGV